MGEIMQEINDNMKIILGGEDEVEIETLTVVLSNTIKILKKASQYTDEHSYQKFVVTDIKKGSFIIEVMAMVASSPNILGNTATAIQMFKNFLDIKKHLNGSEPKSVVEVHNHYKIENLNGDIYDCDSITFNAYTENADIDDSISIMAKKLTEDTQRDGISVNINNNIGNKVEFSKDEIKLMTKRIDLSKLSPNIVSQRLFQKVIVGKIDFDGDSKWTIYINGSKENVKILDEDFKKNISSYKFTKGTVMDVELDVSYHVDNNEIPLNNRRPQFTIIKVFNVLNDEVTQSSFMS
jgi:hypothetical protein